MRGFRRTHDLFHPLYRDRDWLIHQYIDLKRSSGDIAKLCCATNTLVVQWLTYYNIPRRSLSEARALKYWGVSGPDNPMFGKTGSANPRFVDGGSPERQRMYAQHTGKEFRQQILHRDNFKCVRCGRKGNEPKMLHVHHIKEWSKNILLRFAAFNVVTLCKVCHWWVHSRDNVNREYLA